MPVTLIRGMAGGSVVDDEDEARVAAPTPQATVIHVEDAGHSIQATNRWNSPAVARAVRVGTWLAGEGSNLQPTDSKSVVLPIELPATVDMRQSSEILSVCLGTLNTNQSTLDGELPLRKSP